MSIEIVATDLESNSRKNSLTANDISQRANSSTSSSIVGHKMESFHAQAGPVTGIRVTEMTLMSSS